MPDQSNGTDREFTRVQAAAFLTEIGRKMSPQRLATRASEGLGPTFEKTGSRGGTTYKESVLRAWATSPEGQTKSGGRGKRVARKVEQVPRTVSIRLPPLVVDQIRQHIELADQFANGDGNAILGFRFAQSLDVLRRLVR